MRMSRKRRRRLRKRRAWEHAPILQFGREVLCRISLYQRGVRVETLAEKTALALGMVCALTQAAAAQTAAQAKPLSDAFQELWGEAWQKEAQAEREADYEIARAYRETLEDALGAAADTGAMDSYRRAQRRVAAADRAMQENRVGQARLKSQARYYAALAEARAGEEPLAVRAVEAARERLAAARQEAARRAASETRRLQDALALFVKQAELARDEYLAQRTAAERERAYPFRLDEEEIEAAEKQETPPPTLNWEQDGAEEMRESLAFRQRLAQAEEDEAAARAALAAVRQERADAERNHQQTLAAVENLAAAEPVRVEALALARKDGSYVQERFLAAQERVIRDRADLNEARAAENTAARRLKGLQENPAVQAGVQFASWNGADSGSYFFVPACYAFCAGKDAFSIQTGMVYASAYDMHKSALVAPEISWERTAPIRIGSSDTLTYGASVQIPTGSAAVALAPPEGFAADGALPDGGTGFAFTPHIRLTHPLSQTERLEAGASIRLRGAYDTTGFIGTNRYDPGTSWQLDVAYRMVKSDQQTLLRLSYMGEADGTFAGLPYTPGRTYTLDALQSRRFDAKNDWQVYARLGWRAAARDGWSSEASRFSNVGIGWRHHLDAHSFLAANVGYRRATGRGVNPLTERVFGARTGWHAAISYERELSDADRLSVRLEREQLRDDLAGHYRGWTGSLWLNHSL